MNKRNEVLNITFYIITITICMFIGIVLFLYLYKMNTYYLFIAIPMLFLSLILTISNFIKIILTLLLMGLRKNGNFTTVDLMYRIIDGVNKVTKNILIAIFVSLLTSVMILDVALCLYKDKINLLSYSLIMWILIYYFLYDFIRYKIKKDIRD